MKEIKDAQSKEIEGPQGTDPQGGAKGFLKEGISRIHHLGDRTGSRSF
jgi:hypothetical protein